MSAGSGLATAADIARGIDRPPGSRTAPGWDRTELNRLLAAARTMPGEIDGLAARHWWPALLLLTLDTGAQVNELLDVRPADYDRQRGTLGAGLLVYTLSLPAVEAIERIYDPERERLLPWPWDAGRQTKCMLYRRFKEVLYRAGLPTVRCNSLVRLRVTGRRCPDCLTWIDAEFDFTPREGKPSLPRARDRRRWKRLRRKPGPAPKRPTFTAASREQSVMVFLEERYVPVKGIKPNTAADYRSTLQRVSEDLGRELTFADLTDDLFDLVVIKNRERGLKNETINGHIRALAAVWRYAWKKHQVDRLPRDVPRLREEKREPEAWTVDDVALMVRVAAETTGTMRGIPAGEWWSAVLLTLYYTGLRIQALLKLPSNAIDLDTGWLTVKAKTQKQAADQVFRLPADALAALRKIHDPERPYLFGKPFGSSCRLQRLFGEILKRAGLPHSRRDKFHRLRRTSGTYVCNATDEETARAHLGHSNLAVTRRYIDRRKLTRQSTAELLPRPDLGVVRDDSAEDVA